MNPHVQTVQNLFYTYMYGKEGEGNSKAELRTAKDDPYFERDIGDVTKNLETISMLEQNPPERKIEMYVKIFSQEDFAQAIKLWPANFRYTAPFLLGPRILPASPNFGQAKHGQKISTPPSFTYSES